MSALTTGARIGPYEILSALGAGGAFVWMQGHNYDNFADPRIQPMVLRGIAWAAKRPVDALMTVKPPRGRGGA